MAPPDDPMSEADLAEETLDALDEGEAPGGTDRRSPALVLAISLAVLFAIAAAVLGVLAVGPADGDARLDEVRASAGRFGEALVTYDFRDPEAHRKAVLALSTGSFRQEYEDAFDQGLSQIITEVEATSTGVVKDIYVSELGQEDAQAIVVVDIEHTGTGGPRTLYDVYFRLTFVEVDGAWKVDQVTDLNFDTAPASPTTSVP